MVLAALSVLLCGCASGRAVVVPIATVTHAARPAARASTLIVLLPGKSSHAGDFERNGFIERAREHAIDADFVEADLTLGYYEDGMAATRLWEDVVAPARAAGYERV